MTDSVSRLDEMLELYESRIKRAKKATDIQPKGSLGRTWSSAYAQDVGFLLAEVERQDRELQDFAALMANVGRSGKGLHYLVKAAEEFWAGRRSQGRSSTHTD